MIFITQKGFGQNSDNEESGGIYQVVFDSVVNDLSPHLKDSIIIISVEGTSSFGGGTSDYQVINGKKAKLYWDQDRWKLSKEYKNLIKKDLIRLNFRPIVVHSDSLTLSVMAFKVKYKNRSSYEAELVGDALWMFTFKYDCEAGDYDLIEVGKGIKL